MIKDGIKEKLTKGTHLHLVVEDLGLESVSVQNVKSKLIDLQMSSLLTKKQDKMKKQDIDQLKLEIQHIWESGPNEVRILEMVKFFIDKRNLIEERYHRDVLLNNLPNAEDVKRWHELLVVQNEDAMIKNIKETFQKRLYNILNSDRDIEKQEGKEKNLTDKMIIRDVKRSLFIELALRTNLVLPSNEQELQWFEEGTDHKKCGDFASRLFKEVERINNDL